MKEIEEKANKYSIEMVNDGLSNSYDTSYRDYRNGYNQAILDSKKTIIEAKLEVLNNLKEANTNLDYGDFEEHLYDCIQELENQLKELK